MRSADATVSPSADVIRQTARDILARPDYRLKPLGSDDLAWLRWLWNVLKAVLAPLGRLFHTLWDVSPVLAIAYVVALVVVLVVLLWHIVYSFRVALHGRLDDRGYTGAEHRVVDPEELEARARQAAQRQDYITAVRWLFQACLLRLEPADRRALRRGATNHEYLRRFRGTAAYEPLRRFVVVIDFKWYGQGRCERADFDECQRAHAEILLQQGA